MTLSRFFLARNLVLFGYLFVYWCVSPVSNHTRYEVKRFTFAFDPFAFIAFVLRAFFIVSVLNYMHEYMNEFFRYYNIYIQYKVQEILWSFEVKLL